MRFRISLIPIIKENTVPSIPTMSRSIITHLTTQASIAEQQLEDIHNLTRYRSVERLCNREESLLSHSEGGDSSPASSLVLGGEKLRWGPNPYNRPTTGIQIPTAPYSTWEWAWGGPASLDLGFFFASPLSSTPCLQPVLRRWRISEPFGVFAISLCIFLASTRTSRRRSFNADTEIDFPDA